VANLPDLGQLPATRTSVNSASLSALTQAHNQGLRRSLKLLSQQYSDLRIVTLMPTRFIEKPLRIQQRLALPMSSVPVCLASRLWQARQFLFWDSIHPTTAAHRILGERAFSVLQAGRLTASR